MKTLKKGINSEMGMKKKEIQGTIAKRCLFKEVFIGTS
jgi:hypothetical protein